MQVGNQILALKRAQGTLGPAIAESQANARSAQLAAQYAGETMAPRVAQQTATTNLAQTHARAAKFGLSKQQVQTATQIIGAGVAAPWANSGDPLQAVAGIHTLKKEALAAGISPLQADVMFSGLTLAAVHNPKALPGLMATIARSGMEGGTQVGASTQSGPVEVNGQQIIPTNTNPFAAPVGAIPGVTAQVQPPPTQPTFNPSTNTPSVLGAQPPVGIQPAGTPNVPVAEAPIQTEPAPGQAQNYAQMANTAQQDYQHVLQTANVASRNIGLLENIKEQVASGALTGVGAEQRAWIGGLSQFLGLAPNALTHSQIISKQMALLAGMNPTAATDMGRQIALLATPHNGMTAEAMNRVGNELISQLQMTLKEQQFLSQHVTNPQSYLQARSLFNQVNNPRLLQFAQGSPAERARITRGMNPAQKAQFVQQLEMADKMGLLK